MVDSIADVGIQRTTATEIARRSGVTWGAVQHHFGAKDGILVAVLEHSFEHFEAQLGEPPRAAAPLRERATLFIERAWEHFRSPLYRSTFEILLHQVGSRRVSDAPSWPREMFGAWESVWRRFFGDCERPRRRQREIQHFTISALSGLASTATLEGEGASIPKSELALLVDTLCRELRSPR